MNKRPVLSLKKKKPATSKRAQRREAKTWLKETYPELFCVHVPLKIGIDKDIEKDLPPHISMEAVRFVIMWRCRGRKYLANMNPGADRFGLNGPDGVVGEEHNRKPRGSANDQ